MQKKREKFIRLLVGEWEAFRDKGSYIRIKFTEKFSTEDAPIVIQAEKIKTINEYFNLHFHWVNEYLVLSDYNNGFIGFSNDKFSEFRLYNQIENLCGDENSNLADPIRFIRVGIWSLDSREYNC